MSDVDSTALLWNWLRQGWKYRGLNDRPQAEQDWYKERVKYEMGLYLSKGLSDFLLFTADAIRWCKNNGVPIGPGRGSSAASVCCWLLRITEIDPIRYPALLFERFLDVTRMDPPDIDVDCSDERRSDLWDYFASKYGAECVGHIANFVRYRGKNSLGDVALVYGVPKVKAEIVSSLIIERSGGDSRFDSSLGDTVEMFPDAKAIFDEYPDLWKATRLEGNTKGMSVHAAGLIVSNRPLTDVCAVYEQKGVQVLSIDKYDVEYANMIKLDFLGLSTMGMIQLCLDMSGLTLEDLYAVRDDNPETLEVFRNGDVTGIFQFEGRATRLINRDVCPSDFNEVCDINALARPGPLFSGTTAEYTEVKHGRREPETYHETVDRITAHTKGCIIYQEQILQIVREVGGFDWTNANEIRRIIAKKIGQAAFQVSMGNFQEGALRLHGIDSQTSERIWKRIVTSGTYAFVYAHSVSYSMLGWWCAWLKVHYPAEFYAASLSKTGKGEFAQRKAFALMRDAQKHGIKVSPPLLNVSTRRWTAHHGAERPAVVAGWEVIPGLGPTIAAKIERWQGEHGEFADWDTLADIPGVGAKSIAKWQEFCEMPDPFRLKHAERVLGKVREALRSGKLRAEPPIPAQTHTGDEMAASDQRSKPASGAPARRGQGRKFVKGQEIVYVGIVRAREYQNSAENERSRSGDDMDVILKRMKRPDLQDYCVLRCYDDGEEDVYVRTTRYSFPKFRKQLESIDVGTDIVIVRGRKSPGFGTSVFAEEIWVVEP